MFVPLLLFIAIVLVVFLACAVHFVGGKCGSFSHTVKKMFYVAMPGKTKTTRASQKVAKKNRKKRYSFRNHMTKQKNIINILKRKQIWGYIWLAQHSLKENHPLILSTTYNTRSVGWFGAPRTRQFATLGQGGLPANNFCRSTAPLITGLANGGFPMGKYGATYSNGWQVSIALPLTKSDCCRRWCRKKSSQIQTKNIDKNCHAKPNILCAKTLKHSIFSSSSSVVRNSSLSLFLGSAALLCTVYTFLFRFLMPKTRDFCSKKIGRSED